MGGFGPAPKPRSQQRHKGSVNIRDRSSKVLPAGGRVGELPAFPLPQPLPREQTLWAELWRTPQAVMWEQLAWTEIIARYCRISVEAEEPMDVTNSTYIAKARSEARLLEDRLGLTTMSMQRLGWSIGDVEEAAAAPNEKVVDIRNRLKAT